MNIKRQKQEDLNTQLCAIWEKHRVVSYSHVAYLYNKDSLAFTAFFLMGDPDPIVVIDHEHNTITIAE